MYDRNIADQTLNFEPSGGLMNATLVMRDRETDSWWSIMTSDAIGGALDGETIPELAIGEKMPWAEWVKIHPETLVLSVDGQQHSPRNPYANYIENDETFRNATVSDDRLPPKEAIYSFRLNNQPYVVTHSAVSGGQIFEPGINQSVLFFYRPKGASIYLNTVGWTIPEESLPENWQAEDLVARLRDGNLAGERLTGFDTYWYSWIGVEENEGTVLLQ